MHDEQGQIVITLDAKRFVALSLITLFVIVSVGSYIIALLAFDSPSVEFRFQGEIDSIEDLYYSPATTFSAGDTVRITGLVAPADQYWVPPTDYYAFTSSYTCKWIVTVKGPNNKPIHLASGSLSSVTGNQTLPEVSFALPSDAAAGTYKIRVMAWSGWLPSGDTLTFVVLEDTFSVS